LMFRCHSHEADTSRPRPREPLVYPRYSNEHQEVPCSIEGRRQPPMNQPTSLKEELKALQARLESGRLPEDVAAIAF
jgi:hypothetical protein